MAKLLSSAIWPEDGLEHPEYPVELQLTLEGDKVSAQPTKPANWITCITSLYVQPERVGEKRLLFQSTGQITQRDLLRLASDLKAILQQQQQTSLTFVPVTPSFELWLQHLSDEHYRVIIWQDMAEEFGGSNNIAYRGLRFTTNRTRLMGFVRSLEADLQS